MLLTNGRFFVEGEFRSDVFVRVIRGIITQIGQMTAGKGESVLDLNGDAVIPAFVDVHIHAYGGHDVMQGEQSVRFMSRELYKLGVGAFMPTTMCQSVDATRKALTGIQAVMDSPEPDGARVLGAHMEAPFLSEEYRGAQDPCYILAPSLSAYQELTSGLSCVKMMTLAVEKEGALELIGALKERGVVTCCAHSAATAEQVHRAADAGLTQITHLFNAQTPLHHRKPGVPGAGLADNRLYVQVIADGIHLHPDALRIAGLCKGSAKTLLITDSMMAAGMPDGEYSLGGQAVTVVQGAARLHDGTLAGSTLTMPMALQNMMAYGGFAPETAIPMATQAPADSVGAKEYGRIAVGCQAPLLRMDAQWNVKKVLNAL